MQPDPRTPHSLSGSQQVIETIDRQIQGVMKDSNDMIQVYKLMITRALVNKVMCSNSTNLAK